MYIIIKWPVEVSIKYKFSLPMFSTELQIKLGPLIATLTQPLNVERHLLIIAPEVHRERQTLRNSGSTVSKRNINIILVNIIPFIAKFIMKQKFHRKLPT